MATIPTITTIQKTECIGNSLVTINANYDNIRNSIANIITTDLATINSTLNTLVTLTNAISSAQLAKGWVTFQPRQPNLSTGNRTILNSYNVTSVYREDTGKYLITLSEPIATNGSFNVSGVASLMTPFTNNPDYTSVVNLHQDPFPFEDNKSCRIVVRNLLGAQIDPNVVCLTFFGNK